MTRWTNYLNPGRRRASSKPATLFATETRTEIERDYDRVLFPPRCAVWLTRPKSSR